nr:L,D-transpeptidase [Hyphomicrobium sp.]
MSLWRLAFILAIAVPAMTAAVIADETAAPNTTGAIAADEPAPTAVLVEVRSKLSERPVSATPDAKDKEALDQAAIAEFYAARGGKTLWMTDTAITPKARTLVAEIKNADAYGLSAKDFRLPDLPDSDTATLTTEAAADAELQLTTAALKYVRFARGGRISDPAAQLNTNLDRRPQWIEPKVVLEQLASSE